MAAFQRAAAYSYHVVDDLHGMLDDVRPGYQPKALPGMRKVLVAGMVISGVALSVINKVVYEIQAPGRDGAVHNFEKPWFMVLVMFLGMSACLPLSVALDVVLALACARGSHPPSHSPPQTSKGLAAWPSEGVEEPLLLQTPDPDPTPFLLSPPEMFMEAAPSTAPSTAARRRWWLLERRIWLLLLPAAFDMGSSALMNSGLVFITASATQMLRQSLLLFAALLARCWLRKPLNRYHSAGLLGCLVGLLLVSGAVIGSGYGGNGPRDQVTHGTMALGVLLVLLSQLLQAVQLVTDPGCHQRVPLSPLKLVGAEGLMGAALTAFVALPLLSVGRGAEGEGAREDTLDTLAMIRSSGALQLLLLVQLGAVQAYNICGMVIAGDLDTVSGTLLQALRTVFVWMVCLLLRVSPLGGGGAAVAAGPWGSVDPAQGAPPPGHDAAVAGAAAFGGWPVGRGASAPPNQAAQPMLGGQLGSLVGGAGWRSSAPLATAHSVGASWQHQQQQQQQQQHVVALLLPWLLGRWREGGAALQGGEGLNQPAPGVVVGSPGDMQLGEPWGAWSLLQGLGFAIMVAGAVLYGRGDSAHTQYQLLSEAALLLLGAPPPSRSRAGSFVHGAASINRRFMANADFDVSSLVRGFAPRSPGPAAGLVTPPASVTPFDASSLPSATEGALTPPAPPRGSEGGGGARAGAAREALRGLQVAPATTPYSGAVVIWETE